MTVNDDPEPFTLAGAAAAARAGTTAEWVGDFLASRGSDDATLAAALAQRRHVWLGPVRVPLDQLERLAGPETEATCHIDDVDWEHDVDAMQASIDAGWEGPPLLVELRGDHLLLQDGNHRREALLREGKDDGWALIYCDGADAFQRFRGFFQPS